MPDHRTDRIDPTGELPDEPSALLKVYDAGSSLRTWRRALDAAEAAGHIEHARVAREMLAELEDQGHTPLRALAANARLVRLLTGWRWITMLDAREQGATWDEVAAALGMDGAAEARDVYRAAIERQERYGAEFGHDAARARAALDDLEGADQ